MTRVAWPQLKRARLGALVAILVSGAADATSAGDDGKSRPGQERGRSGPHLAPSERTPPPATGPGGDAGVDIPSKVPPSRGGAEREPPFNEGCPLRDPRKLELIV